MSRKLLTVLGLALPALVLQAPVAAEPLAPASQWIPQDAVIVLELSRPKALLDLAFGPKLTAAVSSLPVYQDLESQPKFKQFLGLVKYLEHRLDTDWRTGLAKLLGGGVTFAVYPDETALLIVDAEDGQMLSRAHEVFLGIARGEAAKQGRPDRVASAEYRGVTGWTFGGDEAHAIIGRRLLVSNNPEALKAVVDWREEPTGESLATMPTYQAAKEAAGVGAAARAFVNLQVFKQNPRFEQALQQGQNPLGALLLAGVTEAIHRSNWLALGLDVQSETLKVQAAVDGKLADASGPAAFALPGHPGEGALPNLAVPRLIAGASFYRDLHGFYAAKDDLFPERTSGLIFFENMMGIFFSGRNLTEEVLAEAEPDIRFVVAEQQYDPAVGTPGVQLPAFAAIFHLRHPQQFAEVAEEAWQKALGLINFTRGQQALPGLIIDRPMQGDTKFTVAYFSAAGEKDRTNLDSRFNFRPALAMPGEYLVLSSTEGLARDLIDALKKEAAGPIKALAETHSLVEINGSQLASVLGANRESLVRNNMVKEGNTQEQAETEIDILLAMVKHLRKLTLDFGSHESRPRASLELKLNLP